MAQRRYPRYRLLTGTDDSSFCYRVSEALDLGYQLYGNPALTIREGQGYVAQAVVWMGATPPPSRPEPEQTVDLRIERPAAATAEP